jgi:uncharacterized protein
MPDHLIRYDLLAQQALRGVVRTVLSDVAKNGLPGEHHFKITFNTAASGVRLSKRLRAQYPETMTIILQHQFWNLAVGEAAFEVGLSFGGVMERLAVPFDSIIAFHDPAAQFAFQFEAIEAEAGEGGDAGKTAEPRTEPSAVKPVAPAALPAGKSAAAKKPEPSSPGKEDAPPPSPDGGGGGGEVVRLDRFRKK